MQTRQIGESSFVPWAFEGGAIDANWIRTALRLVSLLRMSLLLSLCRCHCDCQRHASAGLRLLYVLPDAQADR